MLTRELEETLSLAVDEAVRHKHEFVTMEHLLFALLEDPAARVVLAACGAQIDEIARALQEYFEGVLEKVPGEEKVMPELTSTFQSTISYAVLQAEGSGQPAVDGANILAALYQAEQSYAVYLLLQQGITRLDVLNYIAHGISKVDPTESFPDLEFDDDHEMPAGSRRKDPLESFTVELVAKAAAGEIDPIVGRADEIERTIQVLCRRKKNNPLYVGEPGVGKTALAEGLALKISEGDVPEVLADAIDTNVKMIDDYERRAVNPALEVVQACAKVLDVSASYLVGADDEPTLKKKKTGPVTPLERRFQEVRRLPKKKQDFILQFLDTVLESNQQKA